MTFMDPKTSRRYKGLLQSETSPHGYQVEVLVLTTPRGGSPRRVEQGDPFLDQLLLEKVTLDEISRLDRAGFQVKRTPRKVGRRRRS